jgi:hypothetical protein
MRLGGSVSEVRSRRVGGALPERADECQKTLGLITGPLAITLRGGWGKEMRSSSLNQSKTWVDDAKKE